MSETGKTFTFVAAGVIAVAAAFIVGRTAPPQDVQALVGTQLNQFDVEAPKSLRIVRYNPDAGDTSEFEVAEQQGVWKIPSKQGYPADAIDQMAAASTALMDREVLRIQSESAEDHEEFGVVDPTSANVDPDGEGVGVRVVMRDADDKPLVDMIIGKKVKGTDDQYYVRKSTQDVVYVLQLEPEKLTTDFADWIEDDLLQLNTLDIHDIFINDYSASMTVALTGSGFQRQIDWNRRSEMTLAYDSSEATAKWKPQSLKKFDPAQGKMVPFELAEDEQINQDALRELSNGLADLQIVDVERKPSGLGADLKAGEEFLTNREAVENLIERGFAPANVNGVDEIISSEGEIVCTMKNGVEYVLRFGKLRVGGDSQSQSADAEVGDAGAGDEVSSESVGSDGIHRYLFVMAQFNEDAIERPKLKELPELPEGEEIEATEESDSVASDESEGDALADETDADATADSELAAEQVEEEEQEEEVEEQVPVESSESSNDAEATASDGEGSNEADAVADAETDAEAASDDESSDEDSELSDIIAERKSIEQENQRLLDEYEETLTEGQERVAELNERFGDWYYVISNEFYRQIHLGLDDVIEKKEADEDSADADASSSTTSTTPPNGPIPGLPNIPLPGEDDATDDATSTEDAGEAADGGEANEAADAEATEPTG